MLDTVGVPESGRRLLLMSPEGAGFVSLRARREEGVDLASARMRDVFGPDLLGNRRRALARAIAGGSADA